MFPKVGMADHHRTMSGRRIARLASVWKLKCTCMENMARLGIWGLAPRNLSMMAVSKTSESTILENRWSVAFII